MKKILFCLLILITSCKWFSSDSEIDSALQLVPKNFSFFFQVDDLENLSEKITDNHFINKFNETKFFKDLTDELEIIKPFNLSDECIISFSKIGTDDYKFTIITSIENIIKSEDFKNLESITYEKEKISVYPFKNKKYYITEIANYFIISSSKLLIENSIRNTKNNLETNHKLIKIANSLKAKDVSVVIQTKECNDLLKEFFDTSYNFTDFTDWIGFDAKISKKDIELSGVTNEEDEDVKLLNTFKGLSAEKNLFHQVFPKEIKNIISFTFADYITFKDNFNEIYDLEIFNFDVITDLQEIAIAKDRLGYLIAFRHENNDLTTDDSVLENFRNINIYKVSKSKKFNLKRFNTNAFPKYSTIIDEYEIYSEHLNSLKNLISSYQSKNTIGSTEYFKKSIDYLNDESSILVGWNLGKMIEYYHKDYNSIKLNEYPFVAIQFQKKNDFTYLNGIISKQKVEKANNNTEQLAQFSAKSKLITNPVFVKNHYTNQYEIVVQDSDYNLYLVSYRGKQIWKKKLDSKILGEIKQVDVYKNNKLQLAFCTKNKFYIIDRNGKDIDDFPKDFKDDITQPLAVFDYEKSRNYRFLIIQKKDILMVDGNGKTVTGFKFTKSKTAISGIPQHFRIDSKDYLLFKEKSGKLNIMSRIGTSRINVENKFKFSENDIKLHQKLFSFTDTKGNFHQINQQGKVKTKSKKLVKNNGFDATTNHSVFISDNNLEINKKKIELDYGNYSKPKIFYQNNKVYVSVTEKDEQKVLIFDSKGEKLHKSTIFGSSKIDLTKNKDRIIFCVKGGENELLIYKL